jgi:ElaB/YqjD/DUF883 family membrane-anchored ribosome-binding protein
VLLGLACREPGLADEPEPPLVVEEIPPPQSVVDGLQEDVRRLEQEIQSLRAEKAQAAGEPKKSADAKPSVADRLSTVEKSLGKLVDAADKKKKDDAKKPSLVMSG